MRSKLPPESPRLVRNVRTQDAAPTLPALDEKQRYTVRETARYLRISVPRLYQQIAAGEISTFKDGKKRYTPGSEIIRKSRLP